MERNTNSFKAIINNIAKKDKIAAQAVLQTYMLERLLERISISKYRDNFILKGGLLISAMLGIDSRTTMDMDTTIKGFNLDEENITCILKEICELDIKDNVILNLKKVEKIREKDEYGGYRASIEAKYNNELPVIMRIDITTGDKITYKEVRYSFELMLEDRKIQIWSYNLETIIAEKFETIIRRNILTTRIRDFYDVYMLINTQYKNINSIILRQAIRETAMHRETLNIVNDCENIIKEMQYDDGLQQMWEKYRKQNFYAEDIQFNDLILALFKVAEIYKEKNIE